MMIRTLFCSCAAVILAALPAGHSALGETPGLPRVKARNGEEPRPQVAIEGVCAWPNLTVLSDGTIVASIFNQPSHARMQGDVECWATRDDGSTWQLVGTPAKHDRGTNRMNVAAGIAGNGDLLVVASGWAARDPETTFQNDYIIPAWVCRSSDAGQSWAVARSTVPGQTPDGYPAVPFGDIIRSDSGELIAVMYRVAPSTHGHRAFVYRSSDDGKTWGNPSAIDNSTSCDETALLNVGGKHWLAAARTTGCGGLLLYESDDDAKTWKPRGRITGCAQHPGHLFKLSDGSILLSYGNRTAGDKGIDVRMSNDEGRSWSQPQRLCDFDGDGGYPSSVQLANGEILTAYYASESAGHSGYHMGVIKWDAAKTDWVMEAAVEKK
jgi:hypothetical protein